MRIGVWNLKQRPSPASVRGQGMLALIRDCDAEIWLLTEVHTAWSLPGYSSTLSGPRSSGHPFKPWLGILARDTYPLLQMPPSRSPPAYEGCAWPVSNRLMIATPRCWCPARCRRGRTPRSAGRPFMRIVSSTVARSVSALLPTLILNASRRRARQRTSCSGAETSTSHSPADRWAATRAALCSPPPWSIWVSLP